MNSIYNRKVLNFYTKMVLFCNFCKAFVKLWISGIWWSSEKSQYDDGTVVLDNKKNSGTGTGSLLTAAEVRSSVDPSAGCSAGYSHPTWVPAGISYEGILTNYYVRRWILRSHMGSRDPGSQQQQQQRDRTGHRYCMLSGRSGRFRTIDVPRYTTGNMNSDFACKCARINITRYI